MVPPYGGRGDGREGRDQRGDGRLPPELPVVLAAVEAACDEEFAMHGLLATTHSGRPGGRRQRPVAERSA